MLAYVLLVLAQLCDFVTIFRCWCWPYYSPCIPQISNFWFSIM